jgi:hypothetical protein
MKYVEMVIFVQIIILLFFLQLCDLKQTQLCHQRKYFDLCNSHKLKYIKELSKYCYFFN